MWRRLTYIALLGAVVSSTGCLGCIAGNEETIFPEGLEPLEESTAEAPAPMGGQEFPETVTVISESGDDYDWAHGRGFVHATVKEVFNAFKDPEVVADRRETDEQTFMLNHEPQYDYSYLIHYVVNDFITVEWDETWRLGLDEPEDPLDHYALVRNQKIFGTEFINLVEGAVYITAVNEGVSEVAFVTHLDAFSANHEQVAQGILDKYANLLAKLRGEPFPEF